jgi:MFS family permease
LERLLEPLRDRRFRRLVAGRGISFLGDWLLIAGLVGWVYGRTGSTGQVAALMLVRMLPPLAGNLLAGSLADRFPRRRLVLASELACGAAVAGALAGVLLDDELAVFASVAVAALLAPVGSVAMSALVPDLVAKRCLAAANSTLTIATEIAMAGGALAAGLTLGTGSAALALALDVLSFAAAALLYAGIPVGAASNVGAATERSSLRAGLRYVRSRPILSVVACSFALVTLATGLTNATLPRFLTHLGLGEGGYGYALAALAAGSALGEAALGAVAKRVGLRTFAIATALSTLPFTALAFATSAAGAMVALAVLGAVQGAGEVALQTIVQQEAADEFRGRAFGLVAAMYRTTMLSAVAAAPLVNRFATPRVAVLVSASVTAVAAAAATGRLSADAVRRGTSREAPRAAAY